MAITPFRQRIIENCSPPFLRTGTGQRFLYPWGALVDARIQKVLLGVQAHMPTRAQPDAQDQIGNSMGIQRGLTEGRVSYGARLQSAIDDYHDGGTARATLSQALGYLLAMTPLIRFVSTRYDIGPALLPDALARLVGIRVTSASNATPIVITTEEPHGFATGNNVTVSAVTGNTAANGAWTVTVTGASSFSLDTSVGNGAWTGGGRVVLTSGIPSTSYPPTRISSTWDSYPVGRARTAEPVRTYALASGNGDWNWDGLSPISGSWTWWNGWLIIFAVAPNDWCHQAQDFGLGSVYTPAAGGYYSTISGDAWALAGSYTGSTQALGAGSVYAASADGYYSTISGDAWSATGFYTGLSQAIGVDVTTAFGQAFAIIARQFKSAGTWIRSIVVPFDATLFDPAQPADGVHNPSGTFGQWSVVFGDAWTDARFTNAAYGDEVI